MALNALLKSQAEIKAAVEALEGKFKKVSNANRKKTYFSKRVEELAALCDEFEENNKAILELNESSPEKILYVQNKTYEVVKEIMLKARVMYEEAFKRKFPHASLDEADMVETVYVQDNPKKEELTRKTYNVRAAATTDLATKVMSKLENLDSIIELEYELKKMESSLDG